MNKLLKTSPRILALALLCMLAACNQQERRGDEAAALRDWVAARDFYQAAVAESPNDKKLRSKLMNAEQRAIEETDGIAQQCEAARDWDCAINELKTLNRIAPQQPNARTRLANAEAEKVKALLERATSQTQSGDLLGAYRSLASAMEVPSNEATSAALLSTIRGTGLELKKVIGEFRSQRNFDEALALLNAAAPVDASFLSLRDTIVKEKAAYLLAEYNRRAASGLTLLKSKDWRGAIAAYEEAETFISNGPSEKQLAFARLMVEVDYALNANDLANAGTLLFRAEETGGDPSAFASTLRAKYRAEQSEQAKKLFQSKQWAAAKEQYEVAAAFGTDDRTRGLIEFCDWASNAERLLDNGDFAAASEQLKQALAVPGGDRAWANELLEEIRPRVVRIELGSVLVGPSNMSGEPWVSGAGLEFVKTLVGVGVSAYELSAGFVTGGKIGSAISKLPINKTPTIWAEIELPDGRVIQSTPKRTLSLDPAAYFHVLSNSRDKRVVSIHVIASDGSRRFDAGTQTFELGELVRTKKTEFVSASLQNAMTALPEASESEQKAIASSLRGLLAISISARAASNDNAFYYSNFDPVSSSDNLAKTQSTPQPASVACRVTSISASMDRGPDFDPGLLDGAPDLSAALEIGGKEVVSVPEVSDAYRANWTLENPYIYLDDAPSRLVLTEHGPGGKSWSWTMRPNQRCQPWSVQTEAGSTLDFGLEPLEVPEIR